VIEVLSPGLLTTVQDEGRPDMGHMGIPRAGACDPWSLAVANLLAGNGPNSAVLELTIVGPDLRFTEAALVAIAGADLGGISADDGRRLLPGGSYALAAGSVVRFPGPVSGEAGGRAYLAVRGGIDVPRLLGSASTCLAGAFGGYDGRALRSGDRLACVGTRVRPGSAVATDEHRWPGFAGGHRSAGPVVVRVLPGAAADQAGGASSLDALCGQVWTVSSTSDRMGIRLVGARLEPVGQAELLSHGVVWGTVQLPPDGSPIVLLADHQPTGGYPALAVAIVADRPTLGQVRAGGQVRFVPTSPAAALDALRDQRDQLRAGAEVVADAGRWDDLWRSAGG
jgi:biotin-dependent carboxylase-like uncharacterized protein